MTGPISADDRDGDHSRGYSEMAPKADMEGRVWMVKPAPMMKPSGR